MSLSAILTPPVPTALEVSHVFVIQDIVGVVFNVQVTNMYNVDITEFYYIVSLWIRRK